MESNLTGCGQEGLTLWEKPLTSGVSWLLCLAIILGRRTRQWGEIPVGKASSEDIGHFGMVARGFLVSLFGLLLVQTEVYKKPNFHPTHRKFLGWRSFWNLDNFLCSHRSSSEELEVRSPMPRLKLAKSRESLEEEWLRRRAAVLWARLLLVWGLCILSSGSQRNQLKGLLCITELHKGRLHWETETKERVSSWSSLGLCHSSSIPHTPEQGYHCPSPLVWILLHPLLSGSSGVESRALCIVSELRPWPTSQFETWPCERLLRKREDRQTY